MRLDDEWGSVTDDWNIGHSCGRRLLSHLSDRICKFAFNGYFHICNESLSWLAGWLAGGGGGGATHVISDVSNKFIGNKRHFDIKIVHVEWTNQTWIATATQGHGYGFGSGSALRWRNVLMCFVFMWICMDLIRFAGMARDGCRGHPSAVARVRKRMFYLSIVLNLGGIRGGD